MDADLVTAWVRRLIAVALGLALSTPVAFAQEGRRRAEGRSLEDALRTFQAAGLRIIFSSEVVRRDMRVLTEPRAPELRRQLDEVLAPHGLRASPGPAGTIVIVRDERRAGTSPMPSGVRLPGSIDDDGTGPQPVEMTRLERVTVTASHDDPSLRTAGSTVALTSAQLAARRDALVDDPLRALHTLAQTTSFDDFQSEVSIRASASRHIGVVVDGVRTPWLLHMAPGRGDAGTLTMFGSDAIEHVAVQMGAYPRLHGDRLGAEIEFTLRDGSRLNRRLQATINRTMGSATAEGPLGRTERGSWLLTIRRSNIEWPVNRSDHDSTVFGFTDALVRMVYDVKPTQQLSVTALWGQSAVERDDPDPDALADGMNRTAFLNVGWRSVVGSRVVLRQRVAAVVHDFLNVNQSRRPVGAGDTSQWIYRADILYALPGGVLETGAQVQRDQSVQSGLSDGVRMSTEPGVERWTTGAYAHSRWNLFRLTIAPGFRVSGSTGVDRPAMDRWIQVEWRMKPGFALRGSTGVTHQMPAVDDRWGHRSPAVVTRPEPRPERARHVDLGVRQETAGGITWSTTVFTRAERDILQRRDSSFGGARELENGLVGLARGVELSVERNVATGLGGWIGYTFGRARYSDPGRRATWPSEFDRRHVISVGARYRTPNGFAVGATFRASSHVPAPPEIGAGGDALRSYARLDLHGERLLSRGAMTLTLFGDVVNALDRRNVGLTGGWTSTRDQSSALTQTLYPRVYSAGVRVAF